MNHDNDNNPFRSPLTASVPNYREAPSDVEETRRKHLSHEASIQSIGILWVLGGGFAAIYFIAMTAALFVGVTSGPGIGGGEVAIIAGVIFVIGLLAYAGIASGLGIRRLDPKYRVMAMLYAIPGLIGIPIGTLISGYALWLLGSKKGRFIFSPEYAEIRAATPHIKYKTSIIVKIFVGLLLAVVGFAVIAFLIGFVGGLTNR